MAKIVKRVGKTEIQVQRGTEVERADGDVDGPKVVSIWSRVRQRVGIRFDSWINLLTGIGVPGLDAGAATDFNRSARLPDVFLESLYNGDDLAARIVDAIPEEALREGYEIVIEPDESDEAEGTIAEASVAEAKQMGSDVERFLEDELHATEKLTEAWVWGRLFGAGAVYMIVDDGADTDQAEPLDPARVRRIEALTVLDKRDLDPASVYDDPSNPKFGQVETYRVNTFGPVGNITAQIVNVQIHETRLILFEGARTTNREKQTNEGFTLSILQRVFDVLKQFNISWSALANMLQASSQGVFKMHGLIEMIAGGQQDVMQRRMSLVDLQRSVARSLLIDAEEEDYEHIDVNLTGVPDSLRVFMLRIASAAKMPLTVLMGMSPAGMNATGESDRLIWAQTVSSDQNRILRPRLMRLAELAMISSEGPTKGQLPERWAIAFPPLIQMTEEQQATIRKLIAESDAIWIDRQVLLPEEVAISRFPMGGFSMNTVIDVSDRAALLAGDPTPEPEPTPELGPEPSPEPGPTPADLVDPEAVDPTTALNGGQVKALQELVLAVAAGDLPKSTVVLLISSSFPISVAQATLILADIEEPEEKEPTPGGPPPPSGGGLPPTPSPEPSPPSPGGPPPEPVELDLEAERDDSIVWRADRVEKSGPPEKPFCILTSAGERIACHATEVAADRQLAAIEAAKAARGDSSHLPTDEDIDRECREGETREECRARLTRGDQLDIPDHVHADPVAGQTGGIIDENVGTGHRHRRPNGQLTGWATTGIPHIHGTDDGDTGPVELTGTTV